MGTDRPVFSVFSAAKKAAGKRDLASSQPESTPEEASIANAARRRKSSAGSSVLLKTPASNSRTQGSSFVVCPICFGSFARALIDAHVGQCMEAESSSGGGGGTRGGSLPSSQSQSQAQRQRRAGAGATTAATATTPSSSEPLRPLSQVLKPRRGSAFPSLPSQQHRGSGGGKTKASATATPRTTPLPPPPLSQPAPPQPPAAAAAAAAGSSAFAELMRAQRIASLVHVFYLEERRGESFYWHWGTVTGCGGGGGGGTTAAATSSPPSLPPGLPPAAWSAELSIPLPESSGDSSPCSSRQKVTVRLATNLPPGLQPLFGSRGDRWDEPPPQSVSPRLAPSLLKSALQKNVRLGRAEAAVRVAAHMIRQGETGELLRRLPIVAVEDACLSPAMPLAVFAMAAFSKGWNPLPAAAERAVLKFVRSLACSRVRDEPELWEEREGEGDVEGGEVGGGEVEEGEEKAKKKKLDVATLFLSPASSSSSPSLDPQAALLVRVLHLRAAFGGMPCDVSMMRDASRVWLSRFAGRRGMPPVLQAALPPRAPTAPPPQPPPRTTTTAARPPLRPEEAWLSFLWRSFSPHPNPPPASSAALASAPPLTRDDVPLSAVDFHCSAVAEELMRGCPAVALEAQRAAVAVGERKGDEDAAEERLRRAMWLFRSSRNVRVVAASKTSGSASAAAAGVVVLGGDSMRAAALRERISSERDQLRPLWRAAASACDAWAQDYLTRRFSVGGGARGGGVGRRS